MAVAGVPGRAGCRKLGVNLLSAVPDFVTLGPPVPDAALASVLCAGRRIPAAEQTTPIWRISAFAENQNGLAPAYTQVRDRFRRADLGGFEPTEQAA